jgi:hypothetical protein
MLMRNQVDLNDDSTRRKKWMERLWQRALKRPQKPGCVNKERNVLSTTANETKTEAAKGASPLIPALDTSSRSSKSPTPAASSTTVSVEPHLYDDYDWCDLPELVQDSFTVLGYTQEMWDSEEDPETCDTEFCELSPEQQEAARNIGYDAELWDNEDHSSGGDSEVGDEEIETTLPCSAKDTCEIMPQGFLQPPLSLEVSSEMGDSDGYRDDSSHLSVTIRRNYDHYKWEELPEPVRDACKVLDYTEELWDTNQEPESDLKKWRELSSEQQVAASILFYDAEMWDASNDGNSGSESEDELHAALDTHTEERKAEDKGQEYYDSRDCRVLPVTAKKAATVLGYTEELRNQDEDPRRCSRSWGKLSLEEQEVARELGYDPEKWDNDKDCGNPLSPSIYNGMDWDALPEVARASFNILGYTEITWNRDENTEPCDKNWDELCAGEQEAARKVGYNAKEWDGTSLKMSRSARLRNEISSDCRGTFYVVLDSLSMSAFFSIIDEGIGLAEKYVGEVRLNVLKIVVGLLVMRWNGQMFNWLDDGDSKSQKKNKSGRKNMFNSFLNLFSWWIIYSGVNSFFYMVEEEYLYECLKAWHKGIENMAKEAFENDDAALGNFTCAEHQQYGVTSFHRGVGGMMCQWNDEDWGIVSHFYYAAVFLASAFGMFWIFEDNFLESCDEL